MHAPRLLSSSSAIALGLEEALLINEQYLELQFEQWGECGQFEVETFDEWERSMSMPRYFGLLADAYERADNTCLAPGECVRIRDLSCDHEVYVRWWSKADEERYMYNIFQANRGPRYPWEINQWLKGLNP